MKTHTNNIFSNVFFETTRLIFQFNTITSEQRFNSGVHKKSQNGRTSYSGFFDGGFMDAKLYVHMLEKMLTAYMTGNFDNVMKSISNDCVWQSDWKTDFYLGKEEIEKYYSKKGVILCNSETFPTGYVVNLSGSEDHLDGKGVYLTQTYNGQNYDLILTITMNFENCISEIKLCMKELYKFRRFDAAIAQF